MIIFSISFGAFIGAIVWAIIEDYQHKKEIRRLNKILKDTLKIFDEM